MKNYVRRAAGIPLTEEELAQLRALAEKPDSEIDFTDIPESTPAQLKGARHRNQEIIENASSQHLEKAS
jgi:hypothetical protein